MSEDQEIARTLLEKCRHLMCGNEIEACETIIDTPDCLSPDEEEEATSLRIEISNLRDEIDDLEEDLSEKEDRLAEIEESIEVSSEIGGTLERMKNYYFQYL